MEVQLKQYMGGLHWIFSHNGHKLSVICHEGSYGWKKGLFEIMPSWKMPVKNDSVKGNLTFGEVQKWINELKKVGDKELVLNSNKKHGVD